MTNYLQFMQTCLVINFMFLAHNSFKGKKEGIGYEAATTHSNIVHVFRHVDARTVQWIGVWNRE